MHSEPVSQQGDGAPDEYCITVVKDPGALLGKVFHEDGTKTAAASVTAGQAWTVRCETHQQLEDVIRWVSSDPHCALVLSHFGVPEGDEFRILSESMMRDEIGPDGDTSGIHQIFWEDVGRTLPTVCRLKSNAHPSVWILIDRDIDAQTPDWARGLSHEDFIEAIEPLLPGISTTHRLTTLSSSARVAKPGAQQTLAAGHTFVRLSQAVDMDELRGRVKAAALAHQRAWVVNKYKRDGSGEVVAQAWKELMDTAVLSPERLVFCGRPSVPDGWTLYDQTFIYNPAATRAAVDVETLPQVQAEFVQAVTRAGGLEMKVSSGTASGLGAGAAFRVDTLEPSMLVELQDGRVAPISSLLGMLTVGGKVRIQAPFRESSSMAAFLSLSRSGEPFIHDMGTSTSYFVRREDAAPAGTQPAFMTYDPAQLAQDAQAAQDAAAQAIEMAAAQHAAEESAQMEFPEELITGMPPMMRVAYDWMMSSAPNPQKELAFAASLSLIATTLGARFKGPTDLRSNLYIAAIAGTGVGKEHGRQCITRALAAANLSHYQSGAPASGQAVFTRAADHQNTLFQIDEFGMFLRECKNPNSPRGAVVSALLQMTGAANNVVKGTVYADSKTREAKDIVFACVNLHATSTPSEFFGSLQAGDAASGFLNRMLLIECNGEARFRYSLLDKKTSTPPPEQLVSWMKSVNIIRPRVATESQTSLEGIATALDVRATPIIDDMFDRFAGWLEGALQIGKANGSAELWSRGRALALQLAVVGSMAHYKTEEELQDALDNGGLEMHPGASGWAIRLVKHSSIRMEKSVLSKVSESDHEALMNGVLEVIKGIRGSSGSGGPKGATMRDLARICKPFRATEPHKREAVLKSLTMDEEIKLFSIPTTGGRLRHAYVAKDHWHLYGEAEEVVVGSSAWKAAQA